MAKSLIAKRRRKPAIARSTPKSPGRPRKGFVRTQESLAKAMNRSRHAIQQWMDDPRWPFPKTGLLEIAAVRRWVTSTLENRQHSDPSDPFATAEWADLSPERRAKIKLIVTRESYVRLQSELLAGQYMRKSDVELQRVERIHAVKAALMALPRSLPGELVGLDPEAMEPVILRAVKSIADQFSGEART